MSNNYHAYNSLHYVPRHLVCHKEFLYVGREDSSYPSIPQLLQWGLMDHHIWDHHHIHLLGELHPSCSRYHQLGPKQWSLQTYLCFGIPYWTSPLNAWHDVSIRHGALNPSFYKKIPPILQMMILFLYLGSQTKPGPFLPGEGQMIACKHLLL